MDAADTEKLVRRILANPSGMPVAQHEALNARCRAPHLRTAMPVAGTRVQYRHNPHGPLTDAMIEHVDTSNKDDYGVWRFVIDPASGAPVTAGGERLMELVDDPWPDVWLHTDWGRLVTREARIEGSPGWLPYP